MGFKRAVDCRGKLGELVIVFVCASNWGWYVLVFFSIALEIFNAVKILIALLYFSSMHTRFSCLHGLAPMFS